MRRSVQVLRRGGGRASRHPRALSTYLYSPMYPQRPMPELTPEQLAGKPAEDDDFLSRHGGKVALAGFGFAMALVYRWFKGGSNKNEMETEIRNSFLVDPTEFSEIRHNNSINLSVYNKIIEDSFSAFPDGYASYEDFVAFVKSVLKGSNCPALSHAHILDRMILPSVEAAAKRKDPPGDGAHVSAADADGWRARPAPDGRLPVPFLLTCFSAAVRERGEDRLVPLFRIATTLPLDSSGQSASELAENSAQSCTEEQLLEVVHSLMSSYQIPAEKQVTETGVSWPLKTFRRKTASELVKEAIVTYQSTEVDGTKPTFDERKIDQETFRRIMEGNTVCVWGQCYYSSAKNKD